MADLANIFSRLALPRLGQYKAKADGVRSWILEGSYVFAENDTGQKMVLSDVNASEIMPYISFDYERFALASWESFSESLRIPAKPKSVSWPLLQAYYAAFFAAHALMRSLGEAIVKLDTDHVSSLQIISDILIGPGPRIDAGMYLIQLEQSPSGGLSVALTKQPSNSGAHEGFWRAFDAFLSRISSREVDNKSSDAQQLLAGISEVQHFFRPYKQWRSPWLSAVRNEINYQHRHGVWVPRGVNRKNLEVVLGVSLKNSASVRLDYSPSADTIAAFLSASQYFAILSSEVADFVAANSTSVHCFGPRWRKAFKDIT